MTEFQTPANSANEKHANSRYFMGMPVAQFVLGMAVIVLLSGFFVYNGIDSYVVGKVQSHETYPKDKPYIDKKLDEHDREIADIDDGINDLKTKVNSNSIILMRIEESQKKILDKIK